jgi:hypothetical protein
MSGDSARGGHARASAARAETAGWLVALALSVVVVAVVATVSDDLLFTDGDSVIVPMIVRSIALGQPQDWAMSPVLFLPEIAVYGMLSLLGLGMRATLVLNAVLNLLALYGALRVASGRRGAGRAPVVGALTALAVFALLACLEGPGVRDGAQYGTLLTTTSYYSATVVAAVASVGIVCRALDGARSNRRHAVILGGIAVVSMLSNPLFAAWAIVPIAAVLALLAARRRVPRTTAALLAGALAAGGILGYAARVFFADTIVAQNGNYLRIGQIQRSIEAYGGVLARALASAGGVVGIVTVIALWAVAIMLLRRAWRQRATPLIVLGGVAVLGPVITTAGAFAVGADAARYLQPWLYLPLAAFAAVAQVWRSRSTERVRRAGTAVGVGVALLAGVAGVPAAAAAASRTDADLACVVRWVEESGRTGAGQFWTVRAAKANLDDPARLVQVDHTLRVYTWLTNRTDARGAEVTFLVLDAQTVPYVLPRGFSLDDAQTTGCGRYTIADFADRVLPLGPPRN